MSPHQPNPEDLENLVRAHLDREAATVDARALLTRVQDRLRQHTEALTLPNPRPRSAERKRRWLLGLTTAAAVLLAFLGGHLLQPGPASAEVFVREAREAHALPIDRCYLVQSVPEPGGALSRYPALTQPRETRLWTRGDRFWAASTNPDRHWAWGRDDQGSVWLALGGRKHGVRFDREEVPEPINVVSDVWCMRVETLLNEVLKSFLLTREPADAISPATIRIRATPRARYLAPGLRGAILEIDAETRVLRRLVLQRTRRFQPLATVTFTLVETGAQDDASYTLEGHLDPEAPVYTRENKPRLRDQLMRRFFNLPGTRQSS